MSGEGEESGISRGPTIDDIHGSWMTLERLWVECITTNKRNGRWVTGASTGGWEIRKEGSEDEVSPAANDEIAVYIKPALGKRVEVGRWDLDTVEEYDC